MYYKVISIFLLLNIVYVQDGFCAQLLDPTKLFGLQGNEQEEQKIHLKEEFAKIQTSMKERLVNVSNALTQANKLTDEVKIQLQEATGIQQEFFTKKSSVLNEITQALFNIQFLCKEIPLTVEQRIKLLEEILKDPTFKSLSLEHRPFYSYEVFQNEIKRVFDQEDAIKILATQKNDETLELENRKKKVEAAIKSYKDKKKEEEEFAVKMSTKEKPGKLGFKQQSELLDLEEKRALYEKELAELQVQATSKKIELITTGLSIEQEKLTIFKNNLARAKGGLRIAESEVKESRDNLEKLKQKSLAIKETFYEEIKKISADRDILKQELETISKRYKLSVVEREKFTTWSVEPPTVESYSALCEIGFKNEQIKFIERKIEFLRAKIQREDVKFKHEEIKTLSLATWFDIAQHKLVEGRELLHVLKKFKEFEAEMHRELNSFQDQRNAATNLLNIQNKNLSNLRNLIKEIEGGRETLFRRYPLRYNACIAYFAEAEKILSEQIDGIGKLLEVFSGALSLVNVILKETGIVVAEIETRSIWQRSQYAISWRGIKNIAPDLGHFLNKLQFIGSTYFSTITLKLITQSSINVLREPQFLLFIFLFMLFAIGLFAVLRAKLPIVRERLLVAAPQGRFLAIAIKSLGCFCAFLECHLVGIYSWFVLYFAFYVGLISDIFLQILFCLISIPYLIYYFRKLALFFVACNRKHQFNIFAELFEKRFAFYFHFLLI